MSARLDQLRSRIFELRTHLLPDAFDRLGVYAEPRKVEVQARSFVVLSHAEIETYFEDRVVEIAKTALKLWKDSRRVSRPAICLLGFSDQKLDVPPDTLVAPNKNKEKNWEEYLDVTHRFEHAVQMFVKMATKDNHGIKQANLLAMFLPVGFAHGKLNIVDLDKFDNFGSARGAVAHGGTGHVRQPVDPEAEFVRVSELLSLIESFDSEFDQLLSDASGSR